MVLVGGAHRGYFRPPVGRVAPTDAGSDFASVSVVDLNHAAQQRSAVRQRHRGHQLVANGRSARYEFPKWHVIVIAESPALAWLIGKIARSQVRSGSPVLPINLPEVKGVWWHHLRH